MREKSYDLVPRYLWQVRPGRLVGDQSERLNLTSPAGEFLTADQKFTNFLNVEVFGRAKPLFICRASTRSECLEFGTLPARGIAWQGAKFKLEEPAMQKKSLISTLKTTKKANVAAAPAKNEGKSTRKVLAVRDDRHRMSRPVN